MPRSDKKNKTVKHDKIEEKVELEADDVIDIADNGKETGTTDENIQQLKLKYINYRLGMVNLKSFVGKVLLRMKWKFELIYVL